VLGFEISDRTKGRYVSLKKYSWVENS